MSRTARHRRSSPTVLSHGGHHRQREWRVRYHGCPPPILLALALELLGSRGSADAAKFTIDAVTGVLSFICINAPISPRSAPPDRGRQPCLLRSSSPTSNGTGTAIIRLCRSIDRQYQPRRQSADPRPHLTLRQSASLTTLTENTMTVCDRSLPPSRAGTSPTYSILSGADIALFDHCRRPHRRYPELHSGAGLRTSCRCGCRAIICPVTVAGDEQ